MLETVTLLRIKYVKRLDMRDWGSVFRGERAMTPYERPERPKTQFFGQSVTTKTVRNPDGVCVRFKVFVLYQ